MCDGESVDDAVGGASGCHEHHDGVADCLRCDDIAGGNALKYHMNSGLAGQQCGTQTVIVYSRDRCGARKA